MAIQMFWLRMKLAAAASCCAIIFWPGLSIGHPVTWAWLGFPEEVRLQPEALGELRP